MNFQKIFLAGRSTRDAETLTSKSGKVFAKFSVAVNEYSKEKEESTTFYDVLVFGKSAPIAVEKVKKGDLVFVQGRPEASAYLSKDDEAKASLNVISSSWNVVK